MVRAHVFITGRVQGVSYRYYAAQEARALGLLGWVRNVDRPPAFVPVSTGTTARQGVEAVFEGPKNKIEEMVEWCKSPFDPAQGKGPSSAQVSRVEVKWEEPENLSSFEVIS